MLYAFARFVTYIYARIRFKMVYEGLENIPKEGGYILCSNHRSYHDPVFLIHKLPQRVSFMSKEELFKNKFFGKLISMMGAFPVSRGKGDTAALDHSVDIINNKGVLLIFPEGQRSKDGQPGRAKSGAALIASRTKADILCVSIDYKNKLGFRTLVTLKHHPVIPYSELAIEADSPKSIRAASSKIMDTIVSGLTYLESGVD